MADTKDLIEGLYELRRMLSRIPFNQFPEDLPYNSAVGMLTEIKGIVEEQIKADLEIVELRKELDDRNNRIKYLEQFPSLDDYLVEKVVRVFWSTDLDMSETEAKIRKLLQAKKGR